MEKIKCVILFFICTATVYSQSGEWGVRLSGGMVHYESRTARDGSKLVILHHINDDYYGEVVLDYDLYGTDKNNWIYWSVTKTYNMQQRLTGINMYSKYGLKNASNDDGEWIYQSIQSVNEPINYQQISYCDDSSCESYAPHRRLYKIWYGYLDIVIYPKDIRIAYRGDESRLLPFDEQIRVAAPSGYHRDVYLWEYSGDNGITWSLLPQAFQGDSVIRFSAVDIYGAGLAESRLKQTNSQTMIRLKYQTLKTVKEMDYSNIITLSERYASPFIKTVKVLPNKCHDEENGQLIVYFDRSLIAEEKMEVYYNHKVLYYEYPYAADSVVITNLSPGLYDIRVAGFYRQKTTYSGSARHQVKALIQSPLPVTFNANILRDVHCFGGMDGAFSISAWGGVKNYSIHWAEIADPEFETIRFQLPEDSVCKIDRLPAGEYLFYLTDGNGCFEKDIKGNKVLGEIMISQPEQAIHKIDCSVIHPLGYARKDGSLEVSIGGGTVDTAGFYDVVWKNESGEDLSGKSYHSFAADREFYSFLPALGQGIYTMEVTDRNYSSAYFSDRQGCILRDTFILVEPEPLLTTIEETHVVSCHGWKDGELSARVQGGIPFENGLPYRYRWKELDGNEVKDRLEPNDSIWDQLSAGDYFLIVSDKNNNVDTTGIFHLEQPDEIVPVPSHAVISCSDGHSEKIHVTASGGTTPYLFEWNTGEIGDTLFRAGIGTYWVKVSDARGCFRETTVHVDSPEQMKLQYSVEQPVCHRSEDGSIAVDLSGGVPDYTYQWHTGQTTPCISGLSAGIYHLEVKDRNGCVLLREFILEDPPPLELNIGEDRTLCAGQSLIVFPQITGDAIDFLWTKDGKYFSTGEKITVTDRGLYILQISDNRNCRACDTLSVYQLPSTIVRSEFIVSSTTFRNDTIVLVDISDPDPEQAEWLYNPDPALEIVEEGNHILKIIISENGQFMVGRRTYTGQCYEESYKILTVVEPEYFYNRDPLFQPLIKQYVVSPNPNQGQFTATILLEKEAPVRLRLIHPGTGRVLQDLKKEGSDIYNIPYHIYLAPGTYVLVLETLSAQIPAKIIVY